MSEARATDGTEGPWLPLDLASLPSGLHDAMLERLDLARPGGVMVDGDLGVRPGDPAPPEDGLLRVWLFVQHWNAFMAFTAREGALAWVDPV